jgi:hypothetical protein
MGIYFNVLFQYSRWLNWGKPWKTSVGKCVLGLASKRVLSTVNQLNSFENKTSWHTTLSITVRFQRFFEELLQSKLVGLSLTRFTIKQHKLTFHCFTDNNKELLRPSYCTADVTVGRQNCKVTGDYWRGLLKGETERMIYKAPRLFPWRHTFAQHHGTNTAVSSRGNSTIKLKDTEPRVRLHLKTWRPQTTKRKVLQRCHKAITVRM